MKNGHLVKTDSSFQVTYRIHTEYGALYSPPNAFAIQKHEVLE